MTLALLTAQQALVWQTEPALWAHVAARAPQAPRPLVNLAVAAIRRGDLVTAETVLDRAARLADAQPARERAWSLDVIAANRAVVRIRQGRIAEARTLLMDGPPQSARWQICQRAAVCEAPQ